jgi:murein DD-endopeptidase MepM/ murein hydrolase activator NlpD
MPAATRRRGATAIGSNQSRFPQLPPIPIPRPSRRVLAGVSLLALLSLTVSLLRSSREDENAPPPPEPASAARQTVATIHAPPETPPPPPVELAAEPAAPAPELPWVEEVVKRGDNLSLIFRRAGFTGRDVHRLMTEAPDGKALAHLYPGEVIAFQADDSGQLSGVRYIKSPLEAVHYLRGESGYQSRVETRTPEPRQARATGEISSSLFLAGREAGLSQAMIMKMANIFGGVIDFVHDPRKGDTLRLLYEELYLDGEKYSDGEIIAASFTNQGRTYNAFRYQDEDGAVGYYSEEGVSMRRAFLLAPVDFTRISSNFNLRRLHPIYKTSRPHRGTDYAAPTGTPVFAAGDGRVIKAGYTRANGNYVFIQHGEQYVTKYLHLHRRKVKQGDRVAQSQVIGTVGSTGAATGPHLHYEFLVNGVHRDPRTIHQQFPKARSLPTSELPRFRQAISGVSVQLAALSSDNRLAMHDAGDASAN